MTLKANSKKILDIIASGTAQNATQAYRQVHTGASDITARTNSHKLLQKPESQIYLQQHSDMARNKVVELLNAKKEEVQLASAKDILDRVHGKAVQQIEQRTTGVTLTIDLTSSLQEEEQKPNK